ncbi:MAG: ribonuclease Z [Candidatus Aenigmatarchaeota archaeon]
MIQITFLGTVSGVPSKERNHPAIVLEYFGREKDTILFDCGEGTQKQLMKSNISFMKINKIFITHWHADHFAGLIPLIQTMSLEKRKNELKIFGPEAEKFVSKILELGYFGLRFPIKAMNVGFEGERIDVVDEEKEYQILSVPVLHTVPSVAYCFQEKPRWNVNPKKLRELGLKSGAWLRKLKKFGKIDHKGREIRIEEVANLRPGIKIVYTGDTRPCDNVLKISRNADLLIHDGTFLEEEEGKSHADVKQAAKIAKEANVKQLILTHISRRYTDVSELEEEAKKIFPNTKVAHDFMQIKLK